jgi:hypothetical protein
MKINEIANSWYDAFKARRSATDQPPDVKMQSLDDFMGKEVDPIKAQAELAMAANTASAAQAKSAQKVTPTTPAGVQIVKLAGRDQAGRPTPTTVRYRKQDYILTDAGAWIHVLTGKKVNPTLAHFLQTELDTI